jgi:hypothetical protein
MAIKAIIESEAGLRAARGIPAVCGVDKLLKDIILNPLTMIQSIRCAGSLIGVLLRAGGYTKGPLRPCPKDCNAKRGTIWTPPPQP